MIKVTKYENNGERVLLKEDNIKVEFVDGVIKIYDEKGKKVIKTLKSPKTMKKYIEVIESHKAKKGLDSKEVAKEVETVEEPKAVEVEEVKEDNKVKSLTDYIEDKKAVAVEDKEVKEVELVAVEKVEEVAKEVKKTKRKKVVKAVEVVKVEEVAKEVEPVAVEDNKEDKKAVEVEVVKEEEDANNDFNYNSVPMTNKTIVIDATCKAFKDNVDGVVNRCTKFTIFASTDNKELSKLFAIAIAKDMNNNMENNFGYGMKFDEDTLVNYDRGDSHCCEITLTIPYTSGMSEIRKNVCTCYYASKKKVQGFYKELKKTKEAQEKAKGKKATA